jgi:hypothetical protein
MAPHIRRSQVGGSGGGAACYSFNRPPSLRDIRSLAQRAPSSQAGWTIRLRGILQFLGAVPWKAAMAAFAKSWRRE